MSKVLIQKSILISKVLTGKRSHSNQDNSKTTFVCFYKRMNHNGVDRTWKITKGHCKNLGVSREDLLPQLGSKQQSKEEVSRTWKERDLEIEQVNLYIVVIYVV